MKRLETITWVAFKNKDELKKLAHMGLVIDGSSIIVTSEGYLLDVSCRSFSEHKEKMLELNGFTLMGQEIFPSSDYYFCDLTKILVTGTAKQVFEDGEIEPRWSTLSYMQNKKLHVIRAYECFRFKKPIAQLGAFDNPNDFRVNEIEKMELPKFQKNCIFFEDEKARLFSRSGKEIKDGDEVNLKTPCGNHYKATISFCKKCLEFKSSSNSFKLFSKELVNKLATEELIFY